MEYVYNQRKFIISGSNGETAIRDRAKSMSNFSQQTITRSVAEREIDMSKSVNIQDKNELNVCVGHSTAMTVYCFLIKVKR